MDCPDCGAHYLQNCFSWCGEDNQVHKKVEDMNQKALDKQVGGSHYKDMAIQPIEFTHKNNLNFCQGNIIKYATRYKNKNGKEDLEKVIHYAQLLIQLEYGDNE